MGRMVNGLIVLKQLEVGEGGDVSFLSILQAKRKAERFFGGLLLTDPKFKRFQSNWLSLDSLLSFSRGYEDVSIWVLSLGIPELEEQAGLSRRRLVAQCLTTSTPTNLVNLVGLPLR